MTFAFSMPLPLMATTANGTSYNHPTTNYTPAANSLLIFFVSADGCVAPTPTLTATGLTFALKTKITFNTVDTLYVFYAKAPAAPVSAATINFDCTGFAATGLCMTMLECLGADRGPSDPFVQSATNTGSGTAPAVTYGAATKTENAYVQGVGIARATPGGTPPLGFTIPILGEGGHSLPAAGISEAYRINGATATTYTWTMSSGAWGIIGLELRPYRAGARGPRNFIMGPTP